MSFVVVALFVVFTIICTINVIIVAFIVSQSE